MYQRMSRRSALRCAFGLCLGASWLFAGCTGQDETNPEIKTGEAKSAEESIVGKVKKNRAVATPATTQRVKGGGPS